MCAAMIVVNVSIFSIKSLISLDSNCAYVEVTKKLVSVIRTGARELTLYLKATLCNDDCNDGIKTYLLILACGTFYLQA
jgi:hypothetical protein